MNQGEFKQQSIDVTIRFLYSILSESMNIIHENIDIDVENETISLVIKLLF